MANLFEINTYINDLLESASYPDSSYNNLQIESSNVEIQRVALSVDAGLSVIEEAVKQKADLLLVHHGLFWGVQNIITGSFSRKIDKLLKNGCSLIAQHLPLDGNPEVGNNYELARLFEMQNLEGFWPHGEDKFIGVKGSFSETKNIDYFINKAKQLDGFAETSLLKLEFGPQEIKTCAIVSGGGSDALKFCPEENIDLFISGEPKQSVFHQAKDDSLNALFLGHYATETVGVKALGKKLSEEFGVETAFIDEPTGI